MVFIASLMKLSKDSNVDIIRAMDEIGGTTVVDSAELCWNTHPDREYVEEANKATIRIHEYLHMSKIVGFVSKLGFACGEAVRGAQTNQGKLHSYCSSKFLKEEDIS
ncbi:hypothetical protein C5167_028902 [Papaver somniferum]|nr:hypothetical protein C5167_028902 [Papaver somniferum]